MIAENGRRCSGHPCFPIPYLLKAGGTISKAAGEAIGKAGGAIASEAAARVWGRADDRDGVKRQRMMAENGTKLKHVVQKLSGPGKQSMIVRHSASKSTVEMWSNH
jgi:hypothetical protein